jgi:hypothetical protein
LFLVSNEQEKTNSFKRKIVSISKIMDEFREKLLAAVEGEDVWLDFDTGSFVSDSQIREMIRLGSLDAKNVSSRPDIFPVFGDMKAATQALHKIQRVFSDDDDEDTVIQYECHKNVTGFKNPGTSCFMDSALMAMFFLQDSPFYNGVFNSHLDDKSMMCSKDVDENRKLKQEVKDLMKSDIERVIKGEVGYKCRELRNLIGKTCRGSDEDMSSGMHDTSEFLARLLNIVNYYPMIITETISYPENPEMKHVVREQSEMWLNVTTPIGRPNLKWPDFWSSNEARRDDGLLTKTDREIVSADVIIVYINRRVDVGPTTYVKGKPRHVVKIVYHDGPVEYEDKMRVTFSSGEKRTYVLLAAVYAPSPGHYAAILNCEGQWYNYDDSSATDAYENNLIEDDDAEEILSTKSSLLFYY